MPPISQTLVWLSMGKLSQYAFCLCLQRKQSHMRKVQLLFYPSMLKNQSYFGNNFIVSDQTYDIFVCLDCHTEISKYLYETQRRDKLGHQHFKITVHRETGKRSYSPHYPFQQLRHRQLLEEDIDRGVSTCSKQDYALNMDYLYPMSDLSTDPCGHPTCT